MINELTFDPRPFVDKNAAEKYKFFCDLFHAGFAEIDQEINALETERTLKGREVKAIGDLDPVPKTDPIDITDVVKFNDEQKERENKLEKANDLLKSLETSKFQKIDQISQLKNELAKVEAEYGEICNRINKGNEYYDSLNQPEPLKDITTATAQNQKAVAYQDYLTKKSDKDAKEAEYREYTRSIGLLRNDKLKKLSEIKIPVPGLEIREDGIFHYGSHCENWSDEQSVTISSQLCLAMNPKLKAVFIDQGETYDSVSLKELEKWAVANDIQAFITIVDDLPESKEDDVFYIVEGQLVK